MKLLITQFPPISRHITLHTSVEKNKKCVLEEMYDRTKVVVEAFPYYSRRHVCGLQ
jgi:hypothetical protein